MKKALLATTALVAFAGAAAAEVKISGSAEMGIVGGDRYDGGSPMETQFWNDVDIKFTLSGESDSGISFGAVVDLDEAGNLGRDYDNQGTSVFISGDFGTLTLGDTDGAIDWAITDAGDIGNPGTIADDETTHAGYNGTFGDGRFDNQVLRYDYSFDSFGIAISLEQGARPSDGILFDGDPDGAMAIGLKYALDLGGTTVNLGAGYMQSDFGSGTDQTTVAVGAAATFAGGFQAGVTFQQMTDVGGVAGEDVDHTGIGIGYATGPFSIHANWGEYDSNVAGDDMSGWGLAAAYDFGGGLSLNAGYGSSNPEVGSTDNFWSLGMMMSF